MSAPTTAVYAPVRTLMLYLTEDCNLRCLYCFVEKKSRRMSSETARKAIEWFLSRNISGAEYHLNINFFGGEPFLELDRMEDVIAISKERRPNVYKRIEFSATTNGTVASDRVERIIKDSHMQLLISMDGGHEAATYRPFVSGRSSYDLVARNLPRLVNWSPNAIVRTTFHPEALDLLGNVQHLLGLGAPSIALCPVVEARWQGHEEALEAAYQTLADWFIQETRSGCMPPLVLTQSVLRSIHHERQGGSRPARPCSVGHSLLSIDPDGHVMPCHRFLYRPHDWLGTVDTPQLSEQRSRYVQLASRDLLGCESCVAEKVCSGGCRIVVLQAGDDIATGIHPGHCLTMRAHYRAARRIYDTLMADRNPHLRCLLKTPPGLNGAMQELVSR